MGVVDLLVELTVDVERLRKLDGADLRLSVGVETDQLGGGRQRDETTEETQLEGPQHCVRSCHGSGPIIGRMVTNALRVIAIAGAVAAMPSLHVASTCGFYLVARATHRWLGWAFLVFLALMLLGSVHLGWHYAIDGYAGIAGTILLWWGCGRLLRWPMMQRLLWGGERRRASQSAS